MRKQNAKAIDWKKNKSTLQRILLFVKPQMKWVIASFLFATLCVVAQLLVPIFCGNAIDAMIGKGMV